MKLVALVALVASLTAGCGASPTPAQIQQTEQDAFALAGCVLGAVVGGMTDPGLLATKCVGALPNLIVDIVNDFEAKPATTQAMIVGEPLTAQQVAFLDDARTKAVAALARKVSGK